MSKKVVFPFENEKKWNLIKSTLSKAPKTILEFRELYSKLNNVSFDSTKLLKNYQTFLEEQDQKKIVDEFTPNLSNITKYLLDMPELFKSSKFNLLLSTSDCIDQEIKLNKLQVRSLLAASLWGVLEAPSEIYEDKYMHDCVTFQKILSSNSEVSLSKLICIIHYFSRISELDKDENSKNRFITISRHKLEKKYEIKDWENSKKEIKSINLNVDSNGKIEWSKDSLHADFANQFIGGGVLMKGAVQEEILFLIRPECLVSLNFCDSMNVNETIIIKGAEMFSKYKGYNHSFEYDGDYKGDKKEEDENEIVAFDALNYQSIFSRVEGNDYDLKNLYRELTKLHVSFKSSKSLGKNGRLKPFSTGNWGCGVFGGCTDVKSLIQLIAAAECGRDLNYFSFGSKSLTKNLKTLYEELIKKNVTVGELFSLMTKDYHKDDEFGDKKNGSMFPFLFKKFNISEKLEESDRKPNEKCILS